MNKLNIKRPFFMFNPKSYLYGKELLELAIEADKQAEKYPEMSIFVTAPFADIEMISKSTHNIIVTSQHMDGIIPGRGMGHILPESLYNAGARATFLNHAEQPLKLNEIISSIQRANDLGIITVLCADSIVEAKALAMLKPDIILCEPTELIGTGKTSDASYVEKTNSAIREVDKNILIMQAAGISTPEDVYNIIKMKADGTGCTSGITNAVNPKEMLVNMIEAAYEAFNND
ncbi:triose-phosphate isomerase [Aerococcus sp. 1KP-2016]|uniref:triose-phosphate isomerase n=1 Tax=Aerococcus sp. 1KP-2016 TaxID=1981982 RepID=UPI000B98505F|nr:triose-phosphate isomerase [Aerococcus sp. 1KP-2016]OYQ67950.1 triose-phosphate isomerase [Aerococcus sp. 1KP-2016]